MEAFPTLMEQAVGWRVGPRLVTPAKAGVLRKVIVAPTVFQEMIAWVPACAGMPSRLSIRV